MPTIKISTDTTSSYVINATDTSYILEKGVTIDSPKYGIELKAGSVGNHVMVQGNVFGGEGSSGVGIVSLGADNVIEIAKTGKVAANYGIYTTGDDNQIVNRGRIESEAVAVEMTGDGSRLVNHGTIVSNNNYAFYCNDLDDATVINQGSIISDFGMRFKVDDLQLKFGEDSVVKANDYVLTMYSDTGDTSHLVNKGLIATTGGGFSTAIAGYDGNDTVRNSGTIKGNVELGDGDDRFDGRGGQVLNGVVQGDTGNDIYILSDKNTYVYEGTGEGYDKMTLGFSYTFQGFNEIEEVRLSGKGNFNLTANDTGQQFHGNSGNNRLTGGAGRDTLSGGSGTDMLKGGAELDAFCFKSNADRETVIDFTNGEDFIILYAGKQITDVNDLLDHHVRKVDGGLMISGDGTEMFLKGMQRSDLDMNDFITF